MTSSLRQEEIIQWAEAFDMYDVDDEQRILLTQLPLVLATIGKTVPSAQIEALKDRKASEGVDPYLTFDEFLSLLGAGKTVTEAKETEMSGRINALVSALQLYDAGNTGSISVGEARRALAEVLSESEFDGIAQQLDPHSTGKVGIEDLAHYIADH